ncbi:MAG: hypothetical protein MJ153_08425 [Clostridia bacterium]|nr:hypothetical protein [Clostridia bacterium]
MGEIIDLKAQLFWNALTDEVQEMLLHNVYCPNCVFAVLANDATVNIVTKQRSELMNISGTCEKCGSKVSRLFNHRSYPTRDSQLTFDGLVRTLRAQEIAEARSC